MCLPYSLIHYLKTSIAKFYDSDIDAILTDVKGILSDVISFLSGFYLIIYHVLLGLFLWAYWQTIFTDIGLVPKQVNDCCLPGIVFYFVL